MSDDKLFTLNELLAVAMLCRHCGRLATREDYDLALSCDNCYGGLKPRPMDKAETIRAVQTRVDGLSVQPKDWALMVQGKLTTAYVKGVGVLTLSVEDALKFVSDVEARSWAERHLEPCLYRVVLL